MLLGREPEQAVIEKLLADARAARSGVLAFVGETGIGKTALVSFAESCAQAAGMRIARARGIQSEANIPFAGLLELLRPALPALSRIPKPQAEALESALALRPAKARDRFAVGAATLSLLAAHAEDEPLAVLVDDAHWLDGSSANALLFAARRLVADRVAVILTVRDGEPSLVDGSDLAQLRLEGLDGDATAALLGGDGDVAKRLHRETGGNPLALLELAGAELELSGAPVPVVTTLARSFVRRLRALPEPTQRALLLAATADSADLSTLARAAPAVSVDVADLEPGENEGLIHLGAGRVEFRHPLVRSAIYGDASPALRRAVHRALADALPDAELDRRAWHLALATAGPDDRASSALEQAAVRAQGRSAYAVASSAFERAARLAPDDARLARLLYAAAETAWLAGLGPRAAALLDEAAGRWPDRRLAVRMQHLRGHIAAHTGPVMDGHALLAAAATEAAEVEPERAGLILAEAVLAAFYAGDAPEMAATAASADWLLGANGGARTPFFAEIIRGMAAIFAGDGEGGAASVRNAIAILEQDEELADDPLLLTWAAMGPLWLRETDAGRKLVAQALAAARTSSAVGVLPMLLNHVSIDRAGSDQWSAARAGFHEAMRLARESGQHVELSASLSRLAWLAARQGREEECRAYAAEALTLTRALGVGVCEIWTLAALADLELGAGRPEEALTHLEEQQAALDARRITDADLSPLPELVEVYLRLGRTADAAAAAEAFERAAAAKGQPWARARAARARGLVSPDDELASHFDSALHLHSQTPDVFEASRTRLAYGSRLRRARRRVEAREQLREAIDVFDRLGAVRFAELARSELAATGETARRRDPSTVDDLTPQELQIALLLAEGRTTREAAAALFLSPKTIEYHTRNAYRKLGIRSREALATALGGR